MGVGFAEDAHLALKALMRDLVDFLYLYDNLSRYLTAPNHKEIARLFSNFIQLLPFQIVIETQVLGELLEGLLAEHLEGLNAVDELLEPDHVLVDVIWDEGEVLMLIYG